MFLVVVMIAILLIMFDQSRKDTKRLYEEIFQRRISEIPSRINLFQNNPEAYYYVYHRKPWDKLDRVIDRQIRNEYEDYVHLVRAFWEKYESGWRLKLRLLCVKYENR